GGIKMRRNGIFPIKFVLVNSRCDHNKHKFVDSTTLIVRRIQRIQYYVTTSKDIKAMDSVHNTTVNSYIKEIEGYLNNKRIIYEAEGRREFVPLIDRT
ncbi:22970_t:CDS:2, partial [Gigaspora rosea]